MQRIPMKRKYIIAAVTVSVVIILDQLTKWLVATRLSLHDTIVIIPDFLSLHYLVNPGAAFGMLRDVNEDFRKIFFLLVGFFALGLVFYYLIKSDEKKTFFPFTLSLVMGGALGNIIDRVRLGEVTDFILLEATFMGESVVAFLDKTFGSHYWPSFNVADSAIVVGIIGMAVDMFFFEQSSQKEKITEELKREEKPKEVLEK